MKDQLSASLAGLSGAKPGLPAKSPIKKEVVKDNELLLVYACTIIRYVKGKFGKKPLIPLSIDATTVNK